VPRKNGKSPWAAALGHYKFAAEGEHGAEVYSGATSEAQAWEVFRPTRMMALATPDYCEAFGIEVNAQSLNILANGSRFQPVIGKPGDGAAPSCAIIDEFHEHQTSDLYDTMKTGMVGRQNPLIITTAGSDLSGPCRLRQDDVEKMLDGALPDDRLFGIIYTIDTEDDWATEEAARNANPNYGVSVDPRKISAALQGAIASAHKQNVYKTKHLNLWVNAAVAWMKMEKWRALADCSLRLEDFAADPCSIGLDLASRSDLISRVRLFERQIDGQRHYFCIPEHYLNQDKIAEASNASYAGWAKQGFLIATPGNTTDYGRVADDMVEDVHRLNLREVPHDPWHAASLIQFIRARPDWPQTVPFVEVRQTVQQFSPPMKELEALVLEGRLRN